MAQLILIEEQGPKSCAEGIYHVVLMCLKRVWMSISGNKQ